MKGRLEQLHNVSIDDPTDGSQLTYNADDGKWEAVVPTPAASVTIQTGTKTGDTAALTSTNTTLVELTAEAGGTHLTFAQLTLEQLTGDESARFLFRILVNSVSSRVFYFDAAALHDRITLNFHSVLTLVAGDVVTFVAAKTTGSGSSIVKEDATRLTLLRIA